MSLLAGVSAIGGMHLLMGVIYRLSLSLDSSITNPLHDHKRLRITVYPLEAG